MIGLISYWVSENIFNNINFNQEMTIKVWPILIAINLVIVVAIVARQKFPITHKPNQKQTLHKTLHDFTENVRRSYVIATQLYEYDYSPAKGEVIIKFRDGVYARRENIKHIAQHVYSIKPSILIGLEKGVHLAHKKSEFKQLKNVYHSSLKEVFSIQKNGLTKQKMGEATNNYSIFLLITEYLLRLKNEGSYFTQEKVEPIKEVQREVIENENTGLFRAVLNSEILKEERYIFRNNAYSTKSGRTYISFKVEGKPLLILVTLSESLIHMDREQKDHYMDEIVKRYEQMLTQKGKSLIK